MEKNEELKKVKEELKNWSISGVLFAFLTGMPLVSVVRYMLRWEMTLPVLPLVILACSTFVWLICLGSAIALILQAKVKKEAILWLILSYLTSICGGIFLRFVQEGESRAIVSLLFAVFLTAGYLGKALMFVTPKKKEQEENAK